MKRKTRRTSHIRTAEIHGCLVVVDLETRDVTVSSAKGSIDNPARNAVTAWVYETLSEVGWPVDVMDVRDSLWSSLRG